ncbi:MAG TPA: TetR/AcrR family transcriptional regulator [Terracidiphilus sp.]|nr:TetR/AcrR family transcriptional regulator [Terracidiphilus sp.]HEX4283585.1 TetR/AcrR family transcriptional regulator [Terracidiphilus sp.]
MTPQNLEDSKRPYELGKRLEQMDQSRAAILRAAREQLESRGYTQLTMSTLAAESGVTRQTVHNLFGTKAAVLEALFDLIALDGGMEKMREAMTQPTAQAMLERFVEVFCHFWASNRLLLRRIHGIGAIDPEFGAVIEARNQRRLGAATRVVSRIGGPGDVAHKAAALTALTSFEFFDALAQNSVDEPAATAVVLDLARKVLSNPLQETNLPPHPSKSGK